MADCTLELPGLMPHALQAIVPVIEQIPMAKDTYRMRLYCPEIAARIVPGQFFMIRAAGRNDPLLGRPFALYDVYEDNGKIAGLDFGYLAVGKLTNLMTSWKPGDPVEIWGPLGNGFPLPECRHLMCVAGGIGQTPFLAVIREALGEKSYGQPHRQSAKPPETVSLCYGVRSKKYLAGVEDFQTSNVNIALATDDGSHAHKGYVTDLLFHSLSGDNPPDCVFTCGPEPMMKAVANLCAKHNVACWLSLETPMACGIGACFSCVTRIKEGETWDYRRSCVEGPIFPAERLELSSHT